MASTRSGCCRRTYTTPPSRRSTSTSRRGRTRPHMAKSAAAKVPPKSVLTILAVPQGSPEWFEARLGLPTASHFSTVMAQGADGPAMTRTQYLNRLAGEIITKRPAQETFKSRAMERGKEMEPEAIADYETRKKVTVQRIGLAVNFAGLRRCGAS